jgi:uncharacterized protein (DUF58 family)
MTLSPDEVARQVRRLEIQTRQLVRALAAGEYASAFRGRGVEFAEVREYQPGDDIRTIDWNVTARLGQAFVKRFHEERELTVFFLLDISGSTLFGSRLRTKLDLGTEVCAVLALAAARTNDRTGLVCFADRVVRMVEPGRGRRQALRLVAELLSGLQAGGNTGLREGLELMESVLRRRSVLFLISDFLSPGYEGPLTRLGRRHDTIAIQLRDPRERELPSIGLVPARDPESGAWRWIDTDRPEVRHLLARQSAAHDAQVEDQCRRSGVDLLRLETHQSYAEPLLALFQRRRRQRGAA